MTWALRSARFCGMHFKCILMNRETNSQIEHQSLPRLRLASLPYRCSSMNSLQRKLLPSAKVRKDCSSRWEFPQRLCAIPPTGARPNLNKGWNDLLVASPHELRLSRICSIIAEAESLGQPARELCSPNEPQVGSIVPEVLTAFVASLATLRWLVPAPQGYPHSESGRT